MNKIVAGILAIMMLGGSACAGPKKTAKKKKAAKKTSQVLPAKPVNATGMKSVLMGRSACFGTCPVYDVEIFENGLIRYTGKAHVKYLGTYEKKTTAADAINVLSEFNQYQPDTCSYMYQSMIADLPGMHFFISYKDSVKHIINAQDGPPFLREMAKRFDQYGNIDQSWKQTAKLKEE